MMRERKKKQQLIDVSVNDVAKTHLMLTLIIIYDRSLRWCEFFLLF